jgi:hypothetical protein
MKLGCVLPARVAIVCPLKADRALVVWRLDRLGAR